MSTRHQRGRGAACAHPLLPFPSRQHCQPACWKWEGSICKGILTGWQFIFLLPEQGQHLSPYDFKSHCVPVPPGSGRAALTQLRAAAGRAVRRGGCVGHSWAMAHLVNMAVRYYQYSQEFKSDGTNSTREPQPWVSNAKPRTRNSIIMALPLVKSAATLRHQPGWQLRVSSHLLLPFTPQAWREERAEVSLPQGRSQLPRTCF